MDTATCTCGAGPCALHPHRVVQCPNCGAYVSFTDTECWRCDTYFSATAFDSQR